MVSNEHKINIICYKVCKSYPEISPIYIKYKYIAFTSKISFIIWPYYNFVIDTLKKVSFTTKCQLSV